MKSTRLVLLLSSAALAIILIFMAAGSNQPASNSSTAPASNVAAAAGATLSLVNPISGTVDAGQTQTINWTSSNYSAPDVSLSLIRKVSDNPARYELVRMIATSTKNDGSATWVPAPTDVGTGLSIEIGCVLTSNTCTAASSNSAIAVVNDGRFANTASAYQAIENLNNSK